MWNITKKFMTFEKIVKFNGNADYFIDDIANYL